MEARLRSTDSKVTHARARAHTHTLTHCRRQVEPLTAGTRSVFPAFFTTCPVPSQFYDQAAINSQSSRNQHEISMELAMTKS